MNFGEVKIYTSGVDDIKDKLIFINNSQYKEYGFNIGNNPPTPVINVNDAPNKYIGEGFNHWFPIIECDTWTFAPFFGALRVIEYYVKNRGTRSVIVHCAAGMRRSPSIAYAILRTINDDTFDKTKLITLSDGEIMYDFGVKRHNINSDTLKLLKIAHEEKNRNKSLAECLKILYS